MPYIRQGQRKLVDEQIDAVIDAIRKAQYDEEVNNPDGILNYTISRILSGALYLDSDPRYHKINCAVGTLECVKQELYRRVAGPYEDQAMRDNGDIKEYGLSDKQKEILEEWKTK